MLVALLTPSTALGGLRAPLAVAVLTRRVRGVAPRGACAFHWRSAHATALREKDAVRVTVLSGRVTSACNCSGSTTGSDNWAAPISTFTSLKLLLTSAAAAMAVVGPFAAAAATTRGRHVTAPDHQSGPSTARPRRVA